MKVKIIERAETVYEREMPKYSSSLYKHCKILNNNECLIVYGDSVIRKNITNSEVELHECTEKEFNEAFRKTIDTLKNLIKNPIEAKNEWIKRNG